MVDFQKRVESLSEIFYTENQMDYNILDNIIFDFFDYNSNPNDNGKNIQFYSYFTIIFQTMLSVKKYKDAEEYWSYIFESIIKYENEHKTWFPKGTVLYFWAISCLLSGDIDHCYYLMHKAYLEDEKVNNPKNPNTVDTNTPAYYFILLNIGNNPIYEKDWTDKQIIYLQDILTKLYPDLNYSYASFISDFYNNPKVDIFYKYFFSYILGILISCDWIDPIDTSNYFQKFKMVNIFSTFATIIYSLLKKTMLTKGAKPIANIDCINKLDKGLKLNNQTNFDKTRNYFDTDPVNAINQIISSCATNPLSQALVLFYGLRNQYAHNTDVETKFVENWEIILNSCFLVFFSTVKIFFHVTKIQGLNTA